MGPLRPLKVLDLFSGLEGWSTPAKARGHEVVTLDFDPKFGADHVLDITTIPDLSTLEGNGRPFDLILASPPCESKVMQHTFYLIDAYIARHPRTRFVIENPRGVMRKVAPRPPTDTTWYCQWGESRAKPTDLWTNVGLYPDGEWPKCRNGGTDHDAQSRYRAIIPVRLAEAVLNFTEGYTAPVRHQGRTCTCNNQLQPHDRMRVCL